MPFSSRISAKRGPMPLTYWTLVESSSTEMMVNQSLFANRGSLFAKKASVQHEVRIANGGIFVASNHPLPVSKRVRAATNLQTGHCRCSGKCFVFFRDHAAFAGGGA